VITERILPAVALPAPSRPHLGPRPRREPVPRPVPEAGEATRTRPAVARPAVAHRNEAFLTTPARAGMLLGTSAAIYAVSLAAVAALQSSSDAAIAAHRQPYVDAVAQARAANDTLEAAVADADARARAIADRYASAGNDVKAYQARLDALAALVADVEGSAAALPARITLPTVSISGPIASGSRSRPAATTTTRASGAP
jgi:hypothetical protein